MGFPGGSVVKNSLPVQMLQKMRDWYLGREDPLEEDRATHSSILAWRISWTEEPGWLQSMDHKESDTTEWLTHRWYPNQNTSVHPSRSMYLSSYVSFQKFIRNLKLKWQYTDPYVKGRSQRPMRLQGLGIQKIQDLNLDSCPKGSWQKYLRFKVITMRIVIISASLGNGEEWLKRVKRKRKSLSCVRLFVTPWTV